MPRGRAQKTIDLIEASVAILQEIQPATVRAVCYRLFVRGAITARIDRERWERAQRVEGVEAASVHEFLSTWKAALAS